MTLQHIWSELREYPRGVVEEMKKVSWPSMAKTRSSTVVVIAIVAVATVIIGLLDIVFSRLISVMLGL